MSDRGGKKTLMDQEAKSRIMSNEYRKNDGRSTAWSERAQLAADKNEYWQRQETDGGAAGNGGGGSWCAIM